MGQKSPIYFETCPSCGAKVRRVGIETKAEDLKRDVLTFVCAACGETHTSEVTDALAGKLYLTSR